MTSRRFWGTVRAHMAHALQLLAGPGALELIRERGLRAEDVDVLAAASGGPKWLVLSGLDRVLFGRFLNAPRTRPMHLIAASIALLQSTLALKHPYPYVMASTAAIIFVLAIIVTAAGKERRGVAFGAS